MRYIIPIDLINTMLVLVTQSNSPVTTTQVGTVMLINKLNY